MRRYLEQVNANHLANPLQGYLSAHLAYIDKNLNLKLDNIDSPIRRIKSAIELVHSMQQSGDRSRSEIFSANDRVSETIYYQGALIIAHQKMQDFYKSGLVDLEDLGYNHHHEVVNAQKTFIASLPEYVDVAVGGSEYAGAQKLYAIFETAGRAVMNGAFESGGGSKMIKHKLDGMLGEFKVWQGCLEAGYEDTRLTTRKEDTKLKADVIIPFDDMATARAMRLQVKARSSGLRSLVIDEKAKPTEVYVPMNPSGNRLSLRKHEQEKLEFFLDRRAKKIRNQRARRLRAA